MPDCCQVSGQIDLGTPSPLINKNEELSKKKKKSCMCECVRRQRLCILYNHYDLAEPPVFWHVQKQLLFVDTGQRHYGLVGGGWYMLNYKHVLGTSTHAKLMMVCTFKTFFGI